MAITRAQIARELYIKGGVVNPDGRRGFFKGAQDDASKGKGSMSPGTSGGGGSRSGGYGRDQGNQGDQQGDMSIKDFDPNMPNPDGSATYKFIEPPKKPKETTVNKIKKTLKNYGPFKFLDTLSNSKLARINNAMQRQNYIDSLDLDIPEEKEEYDRIMNQLGGLGLDIIGGPKVIGETTVPPSMGFKTPLFEMPQAPPGMLKTNFKIEDGVSTLGDPGVSDILGEGYEEYLDRFKTTGDGGRDDTSEDPCLGPNPPAYCNVNNTTDPTDPKQILTTRILGSQFDPTFFANEGGRAGLAEGGMPYEGGIMDLESGRQMYFLGKLVKKATRAVKKIAKSPIGKAALMYFGGNALASKMGGLGGLRGTLFGQAGSRVGQSFIPYKEGLFTKLGLTKGGGSFMPTIKGGITLASVLPLLAGKEEDDFDIDAYYAANQLTPGTTKRQMGSEFDFYNYNLAEGGMPSKEPVAKETMPLIDMDGKEMDLRAEGGFVPIGRMEKADDVPARLSKNEFVFTADAVRNAGEGDIDKGAEVMYNMMKNLESGGEVSEESQGLDGAREMFQTSKRLEEVL